MQPVNHSGLRAKATLVVFAVLAIAWLAFAGDPVAIPESGSDAADLADFDDSRSGDVGNPVYHKASSRALLDYESSDIDNTIDVKFRQPVPQSVTLIEDPKLSINPTQPLATLSLQERLVVLTC